MIVFSDVINKRVICYVKKIELAYALKVGTRTTWEYQDAW